MLRKILLMLVTLAVCGCSRDSASGHAGISQQALPEFTHALQMPLKVDSTFIMKADSNNRLTFEELRKMKGEFADIEDSRELQHILNDFCRIDSLRSVKKYQSYLDSADIGMTREAIAFKLGTIQLSPRSNLMLWGLNFSSYEACPAFAGNLVIGTITSSEGCTHVPLGKLFSSVDPPAFSSEQLTSEITENWIAINSIRVNDDDMGIPGEEKQTHCYTVQIKEIVGEAPPGAASGPEPNP